MTKKPKVSVLVPVYNVDRFIRKFLDDLVNQTLEEIEIIIVNDASPDSCHDIISEFLGDERIKYINKKVNEGLWKARQSAYEIATAEYIINLDPDDYIDPDFLASLYTFGSENNLDVVVGNVRTIDEKGNIFGAKAVTKISDPMVLNRESDYKLLLSTPYASWFRLFKKDLLERFNYSYLKGELSSYILQFVEKARIGMHPKVYYYYRKHGSSMSNYNKSAKRMSESKEYSWYFVQKKVEDIHALPIASNVLREILNMYVFRVLYSLAMISWLEERPTKRYRSKVGGYLKKELNFSLRKCFKYIPWFKRNEQIFLALCILGLDRLVLRELQRRKDAV